MPDRIKRMTWNRFKRSCKALCDSGKCEIKVHYRYNDYCERDDCPKIKWARREKHATVIFTATNSAKNYNNEFHKKGLTMTAKEWNKKYKIGTKVRYYPIKDEIQTYRESKTRSEAWTLGHGAVIVKIEGVAGGVLIDHLQIEKDA